MSDSNSIKKHNDEIRAKIRALKKSGLTLDEISKMYHGVNKRYLSEIINYDEIEPHPKAAAKLGWIRYKKVPVCPIHGVVHVGKCPDTRNTKPRKPRTPGGWVNAKDPRAAAEQIAKRAQYNINDLIEELGKVSNGSE